MRKLIYTAIALLAFAACKNEFDGAEKPNQAPETQLIVDTIARAGGDRFTSQVRVQWWGTDQDGFVTAYEFRINGSAWEKTTKQDSVFTLIIPGNSDTFDFKFEVRSIDNKNLADESPAMLFFPVKNTAPSVSFYQSSAVPSRNPTFTFPAIRYTWTADDLDGVASLDSFVICFNDTTGPLTKIAPGIRDVLLVATNPTATISDCEIYLGSSQTPWTGKVSGLKLNDSNTLYIRAVDKVGSASTFKASAKIFVRKPSSDILIVNAIESQFTRPTIQNFYTTSFANATAKPYDVFMATDRVGNNYTQLSPDPFTQAMVFKFFKRIFWFTDNTEFTLGLLQKSSSQFFQGGGRMLLISSANDNLPADGAYLDFTPIKTFVPVTNTDAFVMQPNDSLIPTQAGWPVLTTPNFNTGIRPFELALDNVDFGYQVLYNGRITREKNGVSTPWTGISTLIAKRVRKSDNKTNFIISVLPLHQFNGQNNFDAFLNRAVNTELEF